MIVHLFLGRNDADLIGWKKALPKMTFSWYVREVIRADKRGEILRLPLETAPVSDGEELETKLYFTGKDEIGFIRVIPKGKRNKKIKEVLRRHLEANRVYGVGVQDRPVDVKADDYQVKEQTFDDDMSDEYREMLRKMSGK